MILSVQIADVGVGAALRWSRPEPARVSGLSYAGLMAAAPLSAGLLPAPQPRRVGLVAAWEDDAAFERFLAVDPLAARLAGGWHVRLRPLRVYGAYPRIAGLPSREVPVSADEPVAVLTIGELRLRRGLAFLRASARAEAEVLAAPGLLASTGLARPPRTVCTFSLWRSAAEMSQYVRGRRDGAHPAAVAAHIANPFHHESAFIRLRPYASSGRWDGRDPLAGLSASAPPGG